MSVYDDTNVALTYIVYFAKGNHAATQILGKAVFDRGTAAMQSTWPVLDQLNLFGARLEGLLDFHDDASGLLVSLGLVTNPRALTATLAPRSSGGWAPGAQVSVVGYLQRWHDVASAADTARTSSVKLKRR